MIDALTYYTREGRFDANHFKNVPTHQLHREDGPAIIYEDGSMEWWYNGKMHRSDGPAIISSDGSWYWIQNGQIHREDGPATMSAKGNVAWYLNDKGYTIDRYLEVNDKISDRDKMFLKLIWG